MLLQQPTTQPEGQKQIQQEIRDSEIGNLSFSEIITMQVWTDRIPRKDWILNMFLLDFPKKRWTTLDITAWIKIGCEWAKHVHTHKHTDRASHTCTQTPTHQNTQAVCTYVDMHVNPNPHYQKHKRSHSPTHNWAHTFTYSHTPSLVRPIKSLIKPNIKLVCVSADGAPLKRDIQHCWLV